MAGCAGCGGCCAHCGATCGAFGGGSFGGFGGGSFGHLGGAPFMGTVGGFGGLGNFGFLPFFGGHHSSKHDDDDATPVDGDALVDPNHPGHREAIATIAHVDDEKHEKITQWIKDELHRIEHGSDPTK